MTRHARTQIIVKNQTRHKLSATYSTTTISHVTNMVYIKLFKAQTIKIVHHQVS